MRSSTREANLQAILTDDSEVRSHVGDLVEAYKNILAEDVRGTRLAHMIDTAHLAQRTLDFAYDRKRLRESSFPDAILAVFNQFLHRKHPALMEIDTESSPTADPSRNAQFLDKFSLRGVQYSTATCRARDSHVFFQSPEPDVEMSKLLPPQPGQVTHIFLHSHVPVSPGQPHPSIYLCVQPYAPLQTNPELNGLDEMYRRFGFAGGFLCKNELAPPIIIEPSSIISHVAVMPLDISGSKVLHILPMDRVRSSLGFESNLTYGERFPPPAHADVFYAHGRHHRSRRPNRRVRLSSGEHPEYKYVPP